MHVSNFQHKSWHQFFSEGIYSVCEAASFCEENIAVTFTPANPEKLRALSQYALDMKETLSEVLKVNICITDMSGESNSDATLASGTYNNIPVATLPLLTDFGFVINGTKRGIISTLRCASGWYFQIDQKTQMPKMVLQRGATPVLHFRVDSTGKYTGSEAANARSKTDPAKFNHIVVERQWDEKITIPLFKFLKALSGNNSYDEILQRLHSHPRAFSDFMYVSTFEASVEQCAQDSARLLRPNAPKYTDPVRELHKWMYQYNVLRLGPERKPRFQNFISYLKLVGYRLAQPVDLNGTIYPADSIITSELATRLDEEHYPEVVVKYQGPRKSMEVKMRYCEAQDSISYEEVLSAVYQYYLMLDGLGSIDSADNHCNKVLYTLGDMVEDFVMGAMTELATNIRRKLTSKSTPIEDIISSTEITALPQKYVLTKQLDGNPAFQQFDETNSLSSFEQAYRLSTGGEEAPASARDVQKSQFGRVDPFTTSESKKVGLNLSLGVMAGVDRYGFLTTPVYSVSNGVADKSRMIQIGAIEERGRPIAPDTVDIAAEMAANPQGTCPCRVDGEVVQTPWARIRYQYVSAAQAYGPLLSSVPAGHHNSGKRLTMSGNAQRQALPTIRTTRGLVSTGISSIMDIGLIRVPDILRAALAERGMFTEEPLDTYTLKITHLTPEATVTKVTFSTDYLQLDGHVTYSVPRINATNKGSLRHYRLYPKESREYSGTDIVFHANDIDITPAKMSKDTINLGGMTVEGADISLHATGIGNNVRVMFKSEDGFGYEDAIVLNADYARPFGLAASRVSLISKTLLESNEDGIHTTHVFTNQLSELPGNETHYLDENGLPRPGTHLKSGQIYLGIKTTETTLKGEKHHYNSCARLEVGQSGIVVSARLSKDKMTAEVTFGKIQTIDVGDKFSGYHGNKGVAVIILEPQDMPFTASGVPDLIINPLGIPARQNLGQVIEAALGAKAEQSGVICVYETGSSLNVEEVIDDLKSRGIEPEDVYDGRTGLKFPRKALMGNMHFIRSEHDNTSKYNACSTAHDKISTRTQQPVKGHGGGQKLSEMATWCLEAHGATIVKDTLFTLQSDDSQAINKYVKGIQNGSIWDMASSRDFTSSESLFEPYLADAEVSSRKDRPTTTSEIPYTSSDDEFMQAYLRTLGYNLASTPEGEVLLPLTDVEMHALAHGTCNTAYPKDLDIIRDPEIFGDDDSANSYSEFKKNYYGYLPVKFEFIQPIILGSKDFLRMFYVITPKGVIKRMTHNMYGMFMREKIYVMHDFSPEGLPVLQNMPKNNDVQLQQYTGISGLMHIMRNYDLYQTSMRQVNKTLGLEAEDLDFADNYYLETDPNEVVKYISMDGNAKSKIDEDGVLHIPYGPVPREHPAAAMMNKRRDVINKALQTRQTIMHFMQYNDLSDIFVQGVLVPPLRYRPLIHKEASSALDVQLGRIATHVKVIDKARLEVQKSPGAEPQLARLCHKMYQLIEELSVKGPEPKYKSVFDEFTDHQGSKNSVMRDHILAKRIRYSGRSVIVGNSKLTLRQVGVPIVMATKIFEDHLVAMLAHHYPGEFPTLEAYREQNPKSIKRLLGFVSYNNYKGFAGLVFESTVVSYDKFNTCKAELEAMLTRLFDYYYCIPVREPALHKFSANGFQAVPMWGSAIHLPSLACPAYNADFDGDQMAVFFPMHPAAQAELKAKMMLVNNLINPKDGAPIVSINQDMILGIYWATMLKDNAVNVNLHEEKARMVFSINASDKGFAGYKHASFKDLWDAVDLGRLQPQDVILMADPQNRLYKSTAGRILFNSLFPEYSGFTDERDGDSSFFKLRFGNSAVKKSDIEKAVKWTQHLYRDGQTYMDRDTLDKLFDRLKSFGFEMADRSAISISIYDFAELDLQRHVQDAIQQVQEKIKVIEDMYLNGWCSNESRAQKCVEEWQSLQDNFIAKIPDLMNRNSNLFFMIDSKARGDTHQLMEICGIIGNVQNAKGETLEAPILSNYFRGLNPQDAFSVAYKARAAICAAQLSTAVVGTINRRMIYQTDHVHIRNTTMHCNAEPTLIPLEYTLKQAPSLNTRLAVENLDTIHDSYFENGLTREVWTQFADFIREFSRTSLCSDTVISYIQQMHLPRILTLNSSGKVAPMDLQYSLSDISRGMLWFRAFESSALELPSSRVEQYQAARYEYNRLVDGLEDPEYAIVGEQVIHLIEEDFLPYFPIYSMMGCQSSSGICKRCYGLRYEQDKRSLPGCNEYVGYQTTQAIGEPTQQLLLDTHKRVSVQGGTQKQVLERKLNAPLDIPDGAAVAVLAPTAGVFTVTGNTVDALTLFIDGKPLEVFRDIYATDLLKISGTTVRAGEALTLGCIDYTQMVEYADYKDVQVQFWKSFLELYPGHGILARNFEPLALSLAEFGRALEDGSRIYAGEVYPRRQLVAAGIRHTPTILSHSEALETSGKVLAAIAEEFGRKRMTLFAVNGTKNSQHSNIGASLCGKLRSVNSNKQLGIISKAKQAQHRKQESDSATAVLPLRNLIQIRQHSAEDYIRPVVETPPTVVKIDPETRVATSQPLSEQIQDIVEVAIVQPTTAPVTVELEHEPVTPESRYADTTHFFS